MVGKWFPRIVTLAVWTLAALSATWWLLKFVGANAPSASATTLSAPAPGSDPADLAKIFGPPIAPTSVAAVSAPAMADPASRFALVGVVATRASSGVALISVDGKAARPYRVGSLVEETFKLKSVAARSAVVEESASAGTAFTLELKPLAGVAINPTLILPPSLAAAPVLAPPSASVPASGAPPLLRPSR